MSASTPMVVGATSQRRSGITTVATRLSTATVTMATQRAR